MWYFNSNSRFVSVFLFNLNLAATISEPPPLGSLKSLLTVHAMTMFPELSTSITGIYSLPEVSTLRAVPVATPKCLFHTKTPEASNLAKNISKRTLLLNEHLPKNLVDSLIRVSTNVQKQLKSTLDAYLERSAPMAVNVWEGDEQIDDLTNLCMQEVIKYLKENEKNLEDGTHLLFVTKNIERIGDHTTNVAEQIFYLVKGEYLEGDRPKGTEPIVTGEK